MRGANIAVRCELNQCTCGGHFTDKEPTRQGSGSFMTAGGEVKGGGADTEKHRAAKSEWEKVSKEFLSRAFSKVFSAEVPEETVIQGFR